MGYIRITGTVDGLHKSGRGFSIREDYKKSDGTDGSTWSTVFPKNDTPDVRDGQKITVSGNPGANATIKDDGTARARIVINNAAVELADLEPEPEPF
jgi:hypothetical protein